MNRAFWSVIVSAFILSNCLFAQTEEEYKNKLIQINKAMDDFSRAYTFLLDYHYSNIDPQLIIDAAIRGMTNSLDPYTELLELDDSEEFEVLTTNHYTGIGIVTSLRDSMLTIVDIVDNGPAVSAGLRVGDRILKIDGVDVLHNNDEKSRNLLKGELNTFVNIAVLRGYKEYDTLTVTVKRESISQKSLAYYQLLEDSVAYIQVKDFSGDTKSEFKSAYWEMKNKSNNQLKGLIIDLRNNGGGILQSAIELYELFVPVGTLFGTVENKFKKHTQIFSKNSPIDTDIPIVVIVNNYSASASEFLAASFQDINRAVVVGDTTYGKGISQIIRDLPSGKGLKITVDKFYSPIGRAINRIDLKPKYVDDTLKPAIDTFLTRNGQKVINNSGVIPDSIITQKEYTPYLMELISKDAFFHFANKLSRQNIKQNLDSLPSSAIINEFKIFADSLLTDSNSEMEKAVKSIQDIFETDDIPESLKQSFIDLKKGIADYYDLAFTKDIEDIKMIMAVEILKRYYPNSSILSFVLKYDKHKLASQNILKSKRNTKHAN